MKEINRKSIFMTGLRNKVSYVFTNKDLKEVETIIDFYEKQLKQRDEVIDEAINKIEYLRMEKWSIQGTDIMDVLDILTKYKGDNNEQRN